MFEAYPVNPVRHARIEGIRKGSSALLSYLEAQIAGKAQDTFHLIVDGTHGAAFQKWIQQAVPYFQGRGYAVSVLYSGSFLKSGEELRHDFQDCITSNRAFGRVTDEDVEAYFQPDAKLLYQQTMDRCLAANPQSERKLVVTFGPGSAYLADNLGDLTMFLDISREAQQVKHNHGLLNFGMTWNEDSLEKYKIAYFVEWPIWENYRKALLPSIDCYVDTHDEQEPAFVSYPDLSAMIQDVVRYPFRVKPFFAPGVWGGQYLKKLVPSLPNDWVNCAWNFEPVAPENSILIGYQGNVIEVPFLIVMAGEHLTIMGERAVKLFGDYFPIRYNYLDTMDGGRLSVQVHPKLDFMRERFNEFLEEQESYYVMERQNDSKVYLGLTEHCDGERFLSEVRRSQETGEPIEFRDYVQEWNSAKGDLYLIPTGTVHCSGKDNLVLEISATTWWYTMKIYDYARKGMDGKPRPINIDYAEPNIDFYKTTDWVKSNLIPEPVLLRREGENEIYLLGARDDLLFRVQRIHLADEIADDTEGEFILLNLVEGERARIISREDSSITRDLRYAEACIIPAAFGAFTLVNLGGAPCKLIKTGVSKTWNGERKRIAQGAGMEGV
jgi:mannose-6-phosphate isomerase class I